LGDKNTTREKNKHILWVGPYMVFECIAASALEKAYISFGAGSYFKYTGECLFSLGGSVFGVCSGLIFESQVAQIIRNPPLFLATNTC